MSNEDVVRERLKQALDCMRECVPLLEEMDGKIPSDILDIIDTINKYSVLY